MYMCTYVSVLVCDLMHLVVNLISGCWTNWQFPGVQCGPCCDSDPTRGAGSVIWVSSRENWILIQWNAWITLCQCVILHSTVTKVQSHDLAITPNNTVTVMNSFACLATRCCFCGMQGCAGFLGPGGAFKYPGKAWLCIMLLWLCCAHHSCS